MSQPNEPMSPEQAFSDLDTQVWKPFFLHKLASHYGIQPQSNEEAEQLCDMGKKLFAQAQVQNTKSAQATSSLIGDAHGNLNALLGVHNQNEEAAIKQAAAQVINHNPRLVDAAVTFQDAILQQVAGAV